MIIEGNGKDCGLFFYWFNVVIGPLLFDSKRRTAGISILLSLAIPFRDFFRLDAFSSLRLLASFTLLASLIVRSLLFFSIDLMFLGGFRGFVGLKKLNYAGGFHSRKLSFGENCYGGCVFDWLVFPSIYFFLLCLLGRLYVPPSAPSSGVRVVYNS